MATSYVLRLCAVFSCVAWVKAACGAVTGASDNTGATWFLDSNLISNEMLFSGGMTSDLFNVHSRVWIYNNFPPFLLGGRKIHHTTNPFPSGSDFDLTIYYTPPVRIYIAEEADTTGSDSIDASAIAAGWEVLQDNNGFYRTLTNGDPKLLRVYQKLFVEDSSTTLEGLGCSKFKGGIFSPPATQTGTCPVVTVTSSTSTRTTRTATTSTTTRTATSSTSTITGPSSTATSSTSTTRTSTTSTSTTRTTTTKSTTTTYTGSSTTSTRTTTTTSSTTQTTTTTAPQSIIEFMVNNVNYDSLAASSSLLAAFHQALETKLARELPGTISSHYVQVASSKGSVSNTVFVEALVTVPSSAGVTVFQVEAEMESKGLGSLPGQLANHVTAVSGIDTARTGTVTVNEYRVLILTTTTTTTSSATSTTTSTTSLTSTTATTSTSTVTTKTTTTTVITTATATTTSTPDAGWLQVFTGQSTLQVSDPEAFLSLWANDTDKLVTNALAAGIAAIHPAVEPEMVAITNVAGAARRLAAALRRLQGGSGIAVDYQVTVPNAVVVEQGLQLTDFTDNTQAVVDKLNEHLANANTGIVILGVTAVAPSLILVRIDPGAPTSMSQGGASEHAASGSPVIMGLLGGFVILISCIAMGYTIRLAKPAKEVEEVIDVDMDVNAFSCFQVVDRQDAFQEVDDEQFDVDADGNLIPPDILTVKAIRRYI